MIRAFYAWATRSRIFAFVLAYIAAYTLLQASHDVMFSLWQLIRITAGILFAADAHAIWHKAVLHKPSVYEDLRQIE